MLGSKYIIIYRPHGELQIETKYFAANTMGDARQILSKLPALGINLTNRENGVKYIEKLTEFKE